MMGSFHSAVLANPPWVNIAEPTDGIYLDDYVSVNFDMDLVSALRDKLGSIDTNGCVELNRQVLLALHEPVNVQWVSVTDVAPTLYDAYGEPIPTEAVVLSGVIDVGFLHPSFNQLIASVPSSHAFEYAKFLLLQLFSSLIDQAVDYWRAIAEARRIWSKIAAAFRNLVGRNLRHRPFHTPLRLFPSSIHPIDSLA